tara:strand:+ start:241 stop:612 length:372 start_codon:yes stop_codon:yes gene_type:complete
MVKHQYVDDDTCSVCTLESTDTYIPEFFEIDDSPDMINDLLKSLSIEEENNEVFNNSSNIEQKVVRLTPQNASKYIGYDIRFKSRGSFIVKKILGINNSSVKIDHPDLKNSLSWSRKMYVLIN